MQAAALRAGAFLQLFSTAVAYTHTKMGLSKAEDNPDCSESAPWHSLGAGSTTSQLLVAQVSLAECESSHFQGLHASALEQAGQTAECIQEIVGGDTPAGDAPLQPHPGSFLPAAPIIK